MKLKSLFAPGFFHLFCALPVLCGIVILIILLNAQQAVPATSLAPDNTILSETLLAGVYPEPDEVPDGNLPQGEIESEFLPTIINIFLTLVSTVVLGVLLVSATLFIIHFGDEEQLKNAKSWMKWSVVGIVIIIVAYAIVQGVTELTFERESP